MKLTKYEKIGAVLTEDCSIHSTPGNTYAGISSYESSPYGKLAVLDGSNCIRTTSIQSFIQQTAVFTVSFRAKRDATDNTDYLINAGGTAGGTLNGWFVYFNTDNSIVISIYNANNSIILAAGPALTGITTTDWNTYSIVGDGDEIKLYVNGTYFGLFGVFGISPSFLGGQQYDPLEIGRPSNGMKGLVADVVVCDWSWEQNEVTNFANGTFFNDGKDLYANWKLNSDSNSSDSSWKGLSDTNYGFDGTFTNTPDETYISQLDDIALTFTGTEYITLPADSATTLNGISDLSLSAWVKSSGTGGPIISFQNDAETKFEVDVNSNGTLNIILSTTNGVSPTTITSNIKLSDDIWHHIVITLDLSNDTIRIFVDTNEDDATYAGPGDSSFVSGGTTSYIATDGDGSFLEASIADIRIYEKVLSYSQIKDLYKGLEIEATYLFLPFNIDMGSLTYEGVLNIEAIQGASSGAVVYVSPDGTKLYSSDNATDQIHQYTMTTPYDVSTGSYTASSTTFGNAFVKNIYFSPDGTKALSSRRATYIYHYTLSTAWNITTLTNEGSVDFASYTDSSNISTALFNYDGTKLYLGKDSGSDIWQFTLPTPFDITTVEYDGTTTLPDSVRADRMYVSNDGKSIVSWANNDKTYVYSIETAYDLLSTLTQEQRETTVITNSDYNIAEGGNRVYDVRWISGNLSIEGYTTTSLV